MFQSATNRSKPQRALWRLLAFIVTVVGMIGVTAGSASAVTTTTPNSSSGRTASVGLETRVGVTTQNLAGSSARIPTVSPACVGENRPGYDINALASCVATKPGAPIEISSSPKQLQAKYKHAGDFGVDGNYSPANGAKFNDAITTHINSPGVQKITGTYRGNPVTHYLDPSTGLNVIVDPSGAFVSGWKLAPAQLQNVLNHGGLT